MVREGEWVWVVSGEWFVSGVGKVRVSCDTFMRYRGGCALSQVRNNRWQHCLSFFLFFVISSTGA